MKYSLDGEMIDYRDLNEVEVHVTEEVTLVLTQEDLKNLLSGFEDNSTPFH